jgi:CheY-like chemotaxis protein
MDMYLEILRDQRLVVIGVTDAWDALALAANADVIVTGILLASSMDGVELTARLRQDERTNQAAIIVLTACAWQAERERAAHAGCDLFLSKPCLPRDLLRHIRRWLPGPRRRRLRGTPAKAGVLNRSDDWLGVARHATRRKRLPSIGDRKEGRDG